MENMPSSYTISLASLVEIPSSVFRFFPTTNCNLNHAGVPTNRNRGRHSAHPLERCVNASALWLFTRIARPRMLYRRNARSRSRSVWFRCTLVPHSHPQGGLDDSSSTVKKAHRITAAFAIQ